MHTNMAGFSQHIYLCIPAVSNRRTLDGHQSTVCATKLKLLRHFRGTLLLARVYTPLGLQFGEVDISKQPLVAGRPNGAPAILPEWRAPSLSSFTAC